MLANTLTLTINAVDFTLKRVSEQNQSSKYSYKSATESIVLQFRHTVENPQNGVEPVDRHNVFIERTIFATPTASEKYYSYSATARCRRTSDPEVLEDLLIGGNTLITANASAFTDGEP